MSCFSRRWRDGHGRRQVDIVLDVDLRNYYGTLDHTVEEVNHLQNATYKLAQYSDIGSDRSKEEFQIIRTLADQLQQELSNVITSLIPSERNKRGLVTAGDSFLKFLIGTPDSNDLKYLNSHIKILRSDVTDMLHIINEQATVLNTTYRMSKNNRKDITKLAKNVLAVENLIEQIAKNSSLIYDNHWIALENIKTTLRVPEIVLLNLKSNIIELFTSLELTKLNKLSPYLISPTKLQNILSAIISKLPENLQLITSIEPKSLFYYYDLVVTRAILDNNNIRIFVEIPLKSRDNSFNLYQVIPLPFKKNNVSFYIEPELPYFAINKDN